ncbi:MAG: 1-deoxy-D-xylulose-5-phosphate reductoisomerase, partial [Muribaculaceae bacterium]|nr:1-deoxy-D-xylulose-5-phosphate reductoisomerase [Muribaculaceae bacterium]
IINAANEIAVAAFLCDAIGFYDIYGVIEGTLSRATFVDHPEYADYVASNLEARAIAGELVSKISTTGK